MKKPENRKKDNVLFCISTLQIYNMQVYIVIVLLISNFSASMCHSLRNLKKKKNKIKHQIIVVRIQQFDLGKFFSFYSFASRSKKKQFSFNCNGEARHSNIICNRTLDFSYKVFIFICFMVCHSKTYLRSRAIYNILIEWKCV